MREELLAGAPPETIAVCSDSGYITSALFVELIHHFQEKARADTEHSVLLLLDKHCAHLSLEAIKVCCEHSIHLITLSPHSSHKMRPLDKCFFKLLTLYFC
jgi:transposase